MKFKKTVLKNGLRIITVPMKETQTATVVIMVGVGSRYESKKEAGLSHFIEHMFFKGTKKRSTYLHIAEELDSIGGEHNAFTAKDVTGYYAKTDAKHIKTALDIVSDIYLNSKIDAGEIEKEKGTIIQEINMYEDTPMSDVGNVYDGLIYRGNSLGREIIGRKKTVGSFKRENFVNYMNRFYVAGDTVVSIAGRFNEREILEKIKKYFSGMTKGKKPNFKKIVEKQKKPQVKIKFKKTDQTHLIIGNRAYHENHNDRFALSLLSIILGGNMSSRLFVEVREKRGLAYYVRTGIDSYNDCGNISTQAGVEHKNLEETIKVILKECGKISSEKVEKKELQRAKDYIKGRSVMGLEASDEVAMFFVDQELKRKKIMTIDEIFKKIDRVTTDDILRIAKDIFRSNKLNLAVIGPHNNSKRLETILKL